MKFICPACMESVEVPEVERRPDCLGPIPTAPPVGWASYSFWRQDKVTGNVVHVTIHYHLACDRDKVVKNSWLLFRRLDGFNLDYV